MKQKRSYWAEDGTFWEQTFGYCRQNNARLLGYVVNILAAVLGLVLLCLGREYGLHTVVAVGLSFGCAWVAENFGAGCPAIFGPAFGASVGATLAAYLIALGA